MASKSAAAQHELIVERDHGLDGLGSLVADLIAENLASGRRSKLATGRRWAAVVDVVDADSTFVIELGRGQAHVRTQTSVPVSLRIQVEGDTLFTLPEVPLVLGLPDPRRAEGRLIIRKLLTRELKIAGLISHVGRLRRLLTLLNNV